MLPSLCPLGCIEDAALDIRWNEGSFAQEVARRVAVLSEMSIGRGSIVAISHIGGAHVLADLFATWRLGATAACLDNALTDEELRLIISVAKPDILLVDRAAPANFDSIPVLALGDFPPSGASSPAVAVAPSDLALILFTSGTTGEPKGVVLTFAAVQFRLRENIAAIGKKNLARSLVTLPLHFGHGLIGNALAFDRRRRCGAPSARPRARSEFGSHHRPPGDHVHELGACAVARGSPERPPDWGVLVRVHVGSAPLGSKLWSEIAIWSRAEVVNCYGLTETANWVAGASSYREGIAEGLVGKPWGASVAVLGDDGTIQPAGEGEILVKSPAVMSGYFGRPDLTATALVDGWFRTGDRGRLDDRGCIWLVGRIRSRSIGQGSRSSRQRSTHCWSDTLR